MGRPKKFETEEVLDRATDLFWAQGPDAVTTRDLEAALDLRAPAIYRRFKSKDALFARSVNHYVDTVIERRVRVILEGADDPIAALHRFFMSTLEPRDGEHRRGCLLANTATHSNLDIPEVRKASLRGWSRIHTAFAEQISRAQASGQVDVDLDPAAVSQSLLISLQGFLTLIRADIADLRPGIDATFRLLAPGQPVPGSEDHKTRI